MKLMISIYHRGSFLYVVPREKSVIEVGSPKSQIEEVIIFFLETDLLVDLALH